MIVIPLKSCMKTLGNVHAKLDDDLIIPVGIESCVN
jgi:hypothetical protein